jgi:hypothetical protein
LAATVVLAIAICFFLAWRLDSVLALVIGSLNIVVVLLLTTPCRYTLGADHLEIRCGLIRKRICYAEILRVELSSNLLSAPALSLRRVKISYVQGFQLVSPRCRARFIDELSRRAGLVC